MQALARWAECARPRRLGETVRGKVGIAELGKIVGGKAAACAARIVLALVLDPDDAGVQSCRESSAEGASSENDWQELMSGPVVTTLAAAAVGEGAGLEQQVGMMRTRVPGDLPKTDVHRSFSVGSHVGCAAVRAPEQAPGRKRGADLQDVQETSRAGRVAVTAEGEAAEAAALGNRRPFVEAATAEAVQDWAGQTRLGVGAGAARARDAGLVERDRVDVVEAAGAV